MRKRITEILVVFGVASVLYGCSKQNIELRVKLDDLDVVCTVDRFLKPEAQLHGQVKIINNSQKGVIYNLKRITLAVKDDTSSVYIDRFVDFILTDKAIKSCDSISYNVYWAFNRIISPNEINSLGIHIIPPEKFMNIISR